ncbi:hypothetical protein HY636_02365 [Candidatus Woesearchaeota archaeon]|nr:hypothetical protein [Candidatus Woesearchaeota archaeon]
MRTISLLKKLEDLPLFTDNDVSKLVNKEADYVKTLLYRLRKQGLIKRIEKGKYTTHDDPMIFSTHLMYPSYLSLWTALRYFNMTQQQPMDLFVMTPIKRKDINYQNKRIRFIKTKQMFGYRKERYFDFDVFIAEKEKAIIDSMLYKIPLVDIIYALDAEEINFEKLVEYAKKTKNISLIKRVGYILETKTGKSFGLIAKDNNFIKLDYHSTNNGKKNNKWKLIVNMKI